MARGRRRAGARHATRHEHWSHALGALPWITIVLALALLVGTVDLLRPDRYSAEATLEAPTSRAAADAHVLLTASGFTSRVEDEVELDEAWRGTVRISVVDDEEPLQTVVQGTAPDPRLAALAADTAASLIVQDRPEVDYALVDTAAVPTEPDRPRNLLWAWAGLAALAVALWVEGAHRVWLRDHPRAVAEGAR